MKKPSKKELLEAFEYLCETRKVVSRGFDLGAITAPIDGPKYDGTKQWAMKHKKGCGWAIVSGWQGVGMKFVRWNGYIKNRWDFLMLIEALSYSHEE